MNTIRKAELTNKEEALYQTGEDKQHCGIMEDGTARKTMETSRATRRK